MSIEIGDEVAVLPRAGAPASAALDIGVVIHAGPVFIQIADGRTFATIGGDGLNNHGWIVPATEAHREALKMAHA